MTLKLVATYFGCYKKLQNNTTAICKHYNLIFKYYNCPQSSWEMT
jgi:hypothetical protein